MRSTWRLPRGHLLLYAAGSLLLFGSWFAQNVASARWLEELQDRERVLNSIALSEINRAQWLREYNNQVETNRNRDLIGLAAYHFLAETEQILAGIETSLEDTATARERILADKNDRLARADAWLQQSNYEQIVQELNRVQAKYDRDVGARAKMAALRWEATRFATQKWSASFVMLYLVGTVLIACGFLLKECRAPSNEALQPPARKARRG